MPKLPAHLLWAVWNLVSKFFGSKNRIWTLLLVKGKIHLLNFSLNFIGSFFTKVVLSFCVCC